MIDVFTHTKRAFVPHMNASPTLHFDFPDLLIGVAEYEEGPTGCTIFYFPRRVAAAVDIRGGTPGVSEASHEAYDAICFAGGSLLGLEVGSGVRAELAAARGRDVDLVSCAIVNDWGGRDNDIYPDMALGRAAFRAAQANRFPLGACGAGRHVRVGGGGGRGVGGPEPGGQGAAFGQYGTVKIAVFTVVNALGAIVNRNDQVVRGNLDEHTGKREHYHEGLARVLASGERPEPPDGNTTLTLVATNAKLERFALTQLARQVHSSMARAIQPFHTIYDGDVLYAVTTNAVDSAQLDPVSLGILASELAWDAVLIAVT